MRKATSAAMMTTTMITMTTMITSCSQAVIALAFPMAFLV